MRGLKLTSEGYADRSPYGDGEALTHANRFRGAQKCEVEFTADVLFADYADFTAQFSDDALHDGEAQAVAFDVGFVEAFKGHKEFVLCLLA